MLAIAAGVAAVGAAFAVDYLGAGEASGFGSKQVLLATGGALAILAGALLLTRTGQAFLVAPREPEPERHLAIGPLLALAVWFGLFTGLPESLLVLAQRLGGQSAIIQADYAVWMPPIPYVALFCIVAMLLALASKLGWRSATAMFVVLVTFCVISLLTVLFLFEAELHVVAIAILAAGLGVQAARVLSWRPDAFIRLTRRTTIPLVICYVVAGLGLHAARIVEERRELAGLGQPPENAPNILLIILDTVRAPSLSLYEYGRPTTPHLIDLAPEGVVFDRAFSTAPWTLPSHASLFTGHHAQDLSADWGTPLDDTHPTLAEVLRDRGYLTAGFVANRVYTGRASGLNRGFTHYDADVVSLTEFIRSSAIARYVAALPWFQRLIGYRQNLGRKRAEDVSREFLSWLDHTNGAPFFVFLNYYDAHDPYLPDEPYEAEFRTTDVTCTLALISPKPPRYESELRSCVDGYDGSIAELDTYLSRLIDELRARGVLDNTLLIVTSDHGEQFGDHGLSSHGRSVYLPALWVPLLVRFPPRVPSGVRVATDATLRDIPATVIDLLGIEDHSFPGQTLARHWNTETSGAPPSEISPRSVVLSETSARRWLPPHNPASRGPMKSLIAGNMHYILNGDGVEELFDIEADPWERRDLAQDAAMQDILDAFRSVMQPLNDEWTR